VTEALRTVPQTSRAGSVQRLMHPTSVALVGASEDPAAIGGAPLTLLKRFGYRGALHLVSRTRAEVNGTPCVSSVEDLPVGVDVALLAVPKKAVLQTVEAAGRRGIGGVVVFSSGYAELDGAGVAEQAALADAARSAGVALAGPNCLGLVNFVDGVPLTFGDVWPNRRSGRPGVAIIAQSGAMSLALTYAAQAQDITVDYAISTGNEAVLGIEDYLAAVLDEGRSRAVALLIEQVRRPAEFLALASKARELGVALCVLHAGRGRRAQAASRSHTGAIAGDQRPLRAVLSREGVLFIDSLDELIDTVGLLSKTDVPHTEGVAFMTDSGAAKTLAIDICESIGVPLPELSTATLGQLSGQLPPFATASNPVDITAMGLNDPTLYPRVLNTLLADDHVGTVVVSAMPGSDVQGTEQVDALLPAVTAAKKPVVYTIMGGESPLPQANRLRILDAGVPLFRSPERALVAVRNVGRLMRSVNTASARDLQPRVAPVPIENLRAAQEHEAKQLLAARGIPTPPSQPAASAAEALGAAERLGFPVVLKVISPDIAHKSDIGGVALVRERAHLEASFSRLLANVSVGRPDARINGVLVEKAIEGGTEMIVGARRDPHWGPYLIVGLGGLWVEAVGDAVILAGDSDRSEVANGIKGLRAYTLLSGARGGPARDIDALLDAIELIGALVRATPEVVELEVNPLLVLGAGQGVVALDALITCSSELG
jgi:acetate---CoA ligase (ADP-forming)